MNWSMPQADELSPPKLLGERDGRRGANQTSPDLGFLVNGCHGLVLVENKFTERNFERCSGWKHDSNPGRNRCERCGEGGQRPQGAMPPGVLGRGGTGITLKPVINRDSSSSDLPTCPAMRHGYQLFRQQALAEGIAKSGKYELVVSAVAFDERNESLESSLRRSKIDGLEGWGRIFQGQSQVRGIHPPKMGQVGERTSNRRADGMAG